MFTGEEILTFRKRVMLPSSYSCLNLTKKALQFLNYCSSGNNHELITL